MNILVITQLYPQPDDVGGYKITGFYIFSKDIALFLGKRTA